MFPIPFSLISCVFLLDFFSFVTKEMFLLLAAFDQSLFKFVSQIKRVTIN